MCLLQIVVIIANIAAVSPEEVADAVADYNNRSYGYEFTLKVKSTLGPSTTALIDPSGEAIGVRPGEGSTHKVDAIEKFSILGPAENGGRPWRKWQRFGGQDTEIIQEFFVFDGRNTSEFARRRPGSAKSLNLAAALPFEDANLYPINIFDRFLCTNLKGIPEYQDPTGTISPEIIIQWQTPKPLEYGAYQAYSIVGYNPLQKVTHSILVLEPPRSRIVKYELKLKDDPDPLFSQEVLEIDDREGFLYPKRGTFYQKQRDFQPLIDYEFEVTAIQPIDDSSRDTWTFEWPSGTVVNDQINNTTLTVPHAPGELASIQKEQAGSRERGPMGLSDVPQSFSWLLVANITLIVVILGFWLIRSWRSK